MSSPYYKRRRRSFFVNLWIYRRLVALAVVLGLMLWFVLTNNQAVTIAFPFGMGRYASTTGLVILLSALVGAVASAMALTIVWAIRKARAERDEPAGPGPTPSRSLLDDELPPPGYAAKTGDGLNPESRW